MSVKQTPLLLPNLKRNTG